MGSNPGRRTVPPAVLVVAGLDPTGGAGLAADLVTLAAFGCHGLPVATALTVQDAKRVVDVGALSREEVEAALLAAVRGVPPQAIKLGMLAAAGPAKAIASWIASQPPPVLPLVLDPVLAASDGTPLLDDAGLAVLRESLLPLAALVTPNAPEAGRLLDRKAPRDADEAADCARALCALGAGAAVVKGGHLEGEPVDVLFDGRDLTLFRRPRQADARGTGCRFASAVAAGLALGHTLPDAVRAAGDHVAALLAGPRLGPDGRTLP